MKRTTEEAKPAAAAAVAAAEMTAPEPPVANTTMIDDRAGAEEIEIPGGASLEGEAQVPSELLDKIAEAAEIANRRRLSRRRRLGGGARRTSDGQALIEFALLLPLLFCSS